MVAKNPKIEIEESSGKDEGFNSPTDKGKQNLRDLLGVSPEDVVIPLPPQPKTIDEVEPFMEVYRVRLELAQAFVAIDQLELERERISIERSRVEAETLRLNQESLMLNAQQRKFEAEHARAEIDLASARREEGRALALPDQTLIYPFFEEVTDEAALDAINTLGHWSRLHPGADMEIQISTPGGSVIAGLALYDYIQILRRRGHRIRTVALGCAASMGAVLLQAGDERVMGSSAFIMMHEVSYGAQGRLSEQVEAAAVTTKLQNLVIKILCERSTLTPTAVRKLWKKRDHWAGAGEALKLGLVDTIE